MALHTWTLYLLTVIGLSLTPGPNSLLVLAHGAMHGHRRTLWTVAGGALGFTSLIALSMLGISALLQTASSALLVLKVIGGAYLIWLGIQLWRAPAIRLAPSAAGAARASARSLFRQGLLSAISNPKVLLFYGAFLPQFIDPNRDLLLQFSQLAATFVLVEAMVEILIASLAHRVRPWLERSGRRFNQVCGTLFALMGAALPMTR
ncbi:LysE family translocator [Roseateles amylovorans]|uniref:LysE family translocator n=1 Tax=Roseateles amylovorans TaxID=2978473 RepID=A0ABY6AZD1_9BURK|nr:LysE family translocator [Roseateles amylovorans]UXH78047.1 LysE family translocator [Roseateles amylovorans]